MKQLIEWLEKDDKRTRKFLAVFTAIVWLLAVVASYFLITLEYDTMAILSLVTAQFAAVIGFYMATNAGSD